MWSCFYHFRMDELLLSRKYCEILYHVTLQRKTGWFSFRIGTVSTASRNRNLILRAPQQLESSSQKTKGRRIFHSGQRKFLSRTFCFSPTAAQCNLWSRILTPISLLDFCSCSSFSLKMSWDHHFAFIAIIRWKKGKMSTMVLLVAVVVDRIWVFISLRATKNLKNCCEKRIWKILIKMQSPAWRVMIWLR